MMKLIETINNTALAFVALPEAIREARAILAEQRDETDDLSRIGKLCARIRELESQLSSANRSGDTAREQLEFRDKRIAELESDNAKISDTNRDLAKECDRLQSELAAPRERLSANPEPSIPDPECGDGWEFCAKDEATEANVFQSDYSCRGWEGWEALSCFRFNADKYLYRFRRPIAKPEPKWVACTAEEATKNRSSSEFFALPRAEWLSCHSANTGFGDLDPRYAYRTTAPLPLELAVPKSVWDRAPKEAQLFARLYSGAPAYRLMRRHLPDGFRLDAP